MFKKATIGLSLLAASVFANATVIDQHIITGADMAGMEVTVTFADSTTDSGIWGVISNAPLSTGDPIIDGNGFSGGVTGNTWSLTQAGFTLGGVDLAGTPYGLWTLTNVDSLSEIIGFSVNGWTGNAKSVAFDIEPDSEVTPGSDSGQEFVSDALATHAYTNQLDLSLSDLFYQLDVSLDSGLAIGGEFNFYADTDLVSVSAPSALVLMLGGLALFTRKQLLSSTK